MTYKNNHLPMPKGTKRFEIEDDEIVYKYGKAKGDYFTADLDYDGKKQVLVTINIAPSLEEAQSFGEIRNGITRELDYLNEINKFLVDLDLYGKVEGSSDFYWSDGDLLINITIPFNHPMLRHLKLKPEPKK